MSKNDPFRILVLGDLGPGERPPLTERAVRRVDRDDLDRAMRACAPTIHVDVGKDVPPEAFRPLSLEDLKVESLARNLVAPAALLDLRRRLLDPSEFPSAARECGCLGDDVDAGPSVPVGVPSLDDVLTASEQQVSRRRGDWDARVRALVEREVDRVRAPSAPVGQAACVATVAERLQRRLRCVLRDPEFRRLESTWLGVQFLTRHLPTSTDLSIHLLDISRDELVHDLRPSARIDESILFRRIVEDTVGTTDAPPWALVVGLYEFGSATEDIAALTRMSRLASTAEAPFMATARARLFGCVGSESDPDGWVDARDELETSLWSALRGIAEACRIGLFWPPVLLRSPRGARTVLVEEFLFEELDPEDSTNLLCWGSAALVPALVLGRAFSELGWRLRGGVAADVESFPTVLRDTDDGRELVSATRCTLRIRGAERVAEQGVVPLLAHADRATVRLGGLTSLASERTELVGRWS